MHHSFAEERAKRREYDRLKYLKEREAIKAAARAYYEKSKKAGKPTNRTWRKRNSQGEAISRIARRAMMRGLPCDINYLRSLKCPEICPALGTPMAFGKRTNPENMASFDRIDNSRGYIQGNVQIISKLANQMKTHASLEQIKAFAKWALTLQCQA